MYNIFKDFTWLTYYADKPWQKIYLDTPSQRTKYYKVET